MTRATAPVIPPFGKGGLGGIPLDAEHARNDESPLPPFFKGGKNLGGGQVHAPPSPPACKALGA